MARCKQFVTDETVSSTPGIFASFLGPDPLNLLFVVILTSLGTWGLHPPAVTYTAVSTAISRMQTE